MVAFDEVFLQPGQGVLRHGDMRTIVARVQVRNPRPRVREYDRIAGLPQL